MWFMFYKLPSYQSQQNFLRKKKLKTKPRKKEGKYKNSFM